MQSTDEAALHSEYFKAYYAAFYAAFMQQQLAQQQQGPTTTTTTTAGPTAASNVAPTAASTVSSTSFPVFIPPTPLPAPLPAPATAFSSPPIHYAYEPDHDDNEHVGYSTPRPVSTYLAPLGTSPKGGYVRHNDEEDPPFRRDRRASYPLGRVASTYDFEIKQPMHEVAWQRCDQIIARFYRVSMLKYRSVIMALQLVAATLPVIAVLISYGIGMALNHSFSAYPVPYLSYTGVDYPERFVFVFGITSSALAFVPVLLVNQAGLLYLRTKNVWIKTLASLGVILALIAGASLILLAFFDTKRFPQLHYAFDLSFFSAAFFWELTESISHFLWFYEDKRNYKLKKAVVIKFTILVFHLVALFFFIVLSTTNGCNKWLDIDGYDSCYSINVAAAISQYLVLSLILIYMATLSFKKYEDSILAVKNYSLMTKRNRMSQHGVPLTSSTNALSRSLSQLRLEIREKQSGSLDKGPVGGSSRRGPSGGDGFGDDDGDGNQAVANTSSPSSTLPTRSSQSLLSRPSDLQSLSEKPADSSVDYSRKSETLPRKSYERRPSVASIDVDSIPDHPANLPPPRPASRNSVDGPSHRRNTSVESFRQMFPTQPPLDTASEDESAAPTAAPAASTSRSRSKKGSNLTYRTRQTLETPIEEEDDIPLAPLEDGMKARATTLHLTKVKLSDSSSETATLPKGSSSRSSADLSKPLSKGSLERPTGDLPKPSAIPKATAEPFSLSSMSSPSAPSAPSAPSFGDEDPENPHSPHSPHSPSKSHERAIKRRSSLENTRFLMQNHPQDSQHLHSYQRPSLDASFFQVKPF